MIARRVSFGTHAAPKYRNKPTEVDGLKFHSKKEASRYKQLKLLVEAGRVRDLKLQVKYAIDVNGIRICSYTADFTYLELSYGGWIPVVEDVKGYANDRWPMKKKLMRACHGIEVRET